MKIVLPSRGFDLGEALTVPFQRILAALACWTRPLGPLQPIPAEALRLAPAAIRPLRRAR